MKAQYDPYVVF